MDLVFTTEAHFVKCINGKIYSPDGTITINFWEHYLSVFDKIYIIARVRVDKGLSCKDSLIAESEKIKFIEIPDYKGLYQYLKLKKNIYNIIKKEIKPNRAYICRVPGELGRVVSSHLSKKQIPYAVEVVGDPWDVFGPNSIKHILRPLIRIVSYLALKSIVKKSSAALYVTKHKLQKRYPTSTKVFSTYASDVVLKDEDRIVIPKYIDVYLRKKTKINIISIGTLDQMYKSPDVVIKSVKILKDRNINCFLTWLGDGIYKQDMINLGNKLNIADDIYFPGHISSRNDLKEFLLNSDIFVLVSKTEGLPRALIEAMACGLPCIGSHVGGIPELLNQKSIIYPISPEALADKIEYFLNDNSIINEEAINNLKKSGEYFQSVLIPKRIDFLKKVKFISK